MITRKTRLIVAGILSFALLVPTAGTGALAESSDGVPIGPPVLPPPKDLSKVPEWFRSLPRPGEIIPTRRVMNPIPILNGRPGPLIAATSQSQMIGQPLVGLQAANRVSTKAGVYGADLGISWRSSSGVVRMVFGDNVGPGPRGPLSFTRSSALARVNISNPKNIRLTRMDATEVIASLHKPHIEYSNIPTSAISVNGRDYIDFMSVRSWHKAGRWTTNGAVLTRSTDGGKRFSRTKAYRPNRGGWSKFQQTAMVERDGWVYILGTPSGRQRFAYISRVQTDSLETLSNYRFWDGQGWAEHPEQAKPIIRKRTGEMSVRYVPALRKYVLLTSSGQDTIARTSSNLIHWSKPRVIVHSMQGAGLYAPMFLPITRGRNIYYTLSSWHDYTVVVMKTTL